MTKGVRLKESETLAMTADASRLQPLHITLSSQRLKMLHMDVAAVA